MGMVHAIRIVVLDVYGNGACNQNSGVEEGRMQSN